MDSRHWWGLLFYRLSVLIMVEWKCRYLESPKVSLSTLFPISHCLCLILSFNYLNLLLLCLGIFIVDIRQSDFTSLLVFRAANTHLVFTLESGSNGIEALSYKTSFTKWFTWIKHRQSVFVQTLWSLKWVTLLSIQALVFLTKKTLHFPFLWIHLENVLLCQQIPLHSSYPQCFLGNICSSIILMLSQNDLYWLFL